MRRTQEELVLRDLEKKMVFVVGPRQVGKTWMALRIGESFQKTAYLNYDRLEDRGIIKDEAWLPDTQLLILDELHKMPGWKRFIKGVYDTRDEGLRILVTGSARLDTFRRGGDSLAGRYFSHRLLPFSLAELKGTEFAGAIDRLMERGGFPEPFLAEGVVDGDRWRLQYVDGLIREDILDFERIHDLRTMQLVLEMLRQSVGSPVSYASIARDVGAAPNTVKKYIQILESLFIVFRVTPQSRNIARSLLKEPKIYFYDTGMVKDDSGARFENLVAVSLLKHVLGMTDTLGKRHELKYLRTKEGREVDFCLVREGVPVSMVEAKLADPHLSGSLAGFHAKYSIPAVQVVRRLKRERVEAGVEIRSAPAFLEGL
jgi:predicted AAA+ superfamily ATPase